MGQVIPSYVPRETLEIVIRGLQAEGLLTELNRDFLGSWKDREEQRWERVGIELIQGGSD